MRSVHLSVGTPTRCPWWSQTLYANDQGDRRQEVEWLSEKFAVLAYSSIQSRSEGFGSQKHRLQFGSHTIRVRYWYLAATTVSCICTKHDSKFKRKLLYLTLVMSMLCMCIAFLLVVVMPCFELVLLGHPEKRGLQFASIDEFYVIANYGEVL
mgnify:CR=1 FL=1